MKLKPIIVAMMLLGLSAPAFADDSNLSTAAQSQLDAMKAQLDKMEAIINQNNTGGYAQQNDWFKRITLSGMANIDFEQANRVPNFNVSNKGGNTNNLALNNANILLDAVASDWTKVHIGLVYAANRSDAFDRQPTSDTLNEAYVTLGNFNESPLYLRAGKEYVPFGVYQRYPMLYNPTQLLSETQETAAQLGFVSRVGFYGSAYTFRGISKDRFTGDYNDDGVPIYDHGAVGNDRPRLENYGADLGYGYQGNNWSTKLDIGYLDNMSDVDYIAEHIGVSGDNDASYINRVHALSGSADFTVGPFDFGGRYITALDNFDASDIADVTRNDNGTYSADGASPAALGLDAGFSFPVLAHQTRVGLGYQHTWDSASNVGTGFSGVGEYGLPQNRYYGDYVVNVSKWTDVGLEVFYDRDYSVSNGGTGDNSTGGVVRIGVKFA